ncbi:MAG: hypothetical protein L3J03_10580 [Desulfobacterales bacterium]|nr:hypothetical protein [Desulfobacterales bacterium]
MNLKSLQWKRIGLWTGAMVLASAVSAWAVGECYNCHTMHGSQDGTASTTMGSQLTEANDADSATAAGAGVARVSSCLGCHQSATANVSDGTSLTSNSGRPIVYTSVAPTYWNGTTGNTLAGGDFYWVADSGGNTDNTGHNVLGIAAVDGAIGYAPPGWRTGMPAGGTDADAGNGWGSVNEQLRCYGANGCHGDHGSATLQGAHHDNTDGLTDTASTVGNSFRFLLGIKGREDSDYELAPDNTAHNQYFGEARSSDLKSLTTTMSYYCGTCHGIFHSEATAASADGLTSAAASVFGSPWYRHPVDIDLQAQGSEYTAYATYDPIVPVATSNASITLVDGTVQTAGNGLVTCISCHRAHGSPYADLLRWQYSDMIVKTTGAGQGKGCFVCHSTKDG